MRNAFPAKALYPLMSAKLYHNAYDRWFLITVKSSPVVMVPAPGAVAPQASAVAGSARPRRAAAAGEEGAGREADVSPARQ